MGLFEEVEYTIGQLYQYSEKVTFFAIIDNIVFRTVIGSALCVIPFLIVIGLIYWFVRKAWQKRRCAVSDLEFKEMRRGCRLNEIVRLLLVCWIAGVVLFLIIPYDTCHGLLYSIRYSRWYLEDRQSPWTFGTYSLDSALLARLTGTVTESTWNKEMLIGNAALFVPLGFALPFALSRRSLPKTLLAGAACTLFVELIQPIFERSFDIDDVIFNFIGVIAGYLLFLVIRLIFPKFVEKCRQTLKVKKQT